MADQSSEDANGKAKPKPLAQSEKDARLAEALRANLRRRKAGSDKPRES